MVGTVIGAVVVVLLLLAPRFILDLVGRAGQGVARLFLPPEGMSGWPRGVQEDDRRWGWRTGAAAAEPEPPEPAGRTPHGIEVIDL